MPHTISLEQISIPEPCHADWNAMAGDDQKRFCDSCQKHVHDLSTHTRAEAEALLTSHAGKLCVQFRRTPDGQVLTSDTPTPRARGRWGWGGISMLVAFALSLIGCEREEGVNDNIPLPGEVMVRTAGMVATTQNTIRGDVALPPTTQTFEMGRIVSKGKVAVPPEATVDPATTQPAVLGGIQVSHTKCALE